VTGIADALTEGVGHLADARASIFRAGDVLGQVSAAFDDELKGLFENTDELLGRVERLRARMEEARL
jgi:hypothetical protein